MDSILLFLWCWVTASSEILKRLKTQSVYLGNIGLWCENHSEVSRLFLTFAGSSLGPWLNLTEHLSIYSAGRQKISLHHPIWLRYEGDIEVSCERGTLSAVSNCRELSCGSKTRSGHQSFPVGESRCIIQWRETIARIEQDLARLRPPSLLRDTATDLHSQIADWVPGSWPTTTAMSMLSDSAWQDQKIFKRITGRRCSKVMQCQSKVHQKTRGESVLMESQFSEKFDVANLLRKLSNPRKK